ncbi:DUF4395 domain-containing protein [Micromonospora halophytica]|uniref:DUF4395 domain-containing protein n=1 Tax=Micromonospora halophytica TaxID=47864 RepID=A0A1C5HJT6_9ACTN|nr:DUF4395 domain-containing protein [Micromonospora halophytica]SCG46127.1 protein of unknown function [Micromonospora halophytica]
MLLDPRAPRFAAAVTTVVLAAALITGAVPVLLAQAAVFALAAVNPSLGPYSLVWRVLVAPRLDPPSELEPAAPVRFAQLVGLVFTLLAIVGQLTGASVPALAATGAALAAAFLNVAFDLCLGCETYLALRRVTGRPVTARVPVGS